MSTFKLKVLACNRVFYDGECEILIFDNLDGEMAILPNHEAMTTVVEIGTIRFRMPDGTWVKGIVSDGVLTVEKNLVKVLVYSCEKPEEIDAFRAKEAMERAKEQLSHKQSIIDYHISTAALARAMARLKNASSGEKI